MWRGHLTAAEMRLLDTTLRTTHRRRIDIDILDLNEKHVGSLSPQVLDGQVSIDAKADATTPSRMLDITILDPDRVIDLEPTTVTGAPLHRQFMLKVYYTVLVPATVFPDFTTDPFSSLYGAGSYGAGLYGVGPYYGMAVAAFGEWIQIPVFTGPLWDFERTGAEVHLVAHGKERQALGNKWTPRQFKKKTKKTTAITALLRGTGERRLAIPDLRATLPDRFTVGPMDQPWVKAKHLAKSMDPERHLFYDGDGLARLRVPATEPCATFDGSLLSEPTMKRSSEGVVNTFSVLGRNPKGPKKRVSSGPVTLPPQHASSPKSLARNGEWLRLVLRETNDHYKTNAACKHRAERLRDIHWTTANEFEVDVMPDPRLDELDMVAVQTDLGRVRVLMQQWSIPLGMDAAPMHVGTVRRTTRARPNR